MTEQLPENFDWVTARSKCSVQEVFERLREQVKNDVQLRDKILGGRDGLTYIKFSEPSATMFTVVREPDAGLKMAVRFDLKKDSIIVTQQPENLEIGATVTLSNDGKCRVKIQEQEYDLWQLRKKALESVLF